MVASELAWLSVDGEGLADLRDLFKEEIARERSMQGDAVNRIERDLGFVEERLSRLTDALLDELIDKTAYEERRAKLLHRKRALKEQLASDETSTFWKSVADKFERGLTASSAYISANSPEKRDAVTTFGSNVVADVKNPYFPMSFPFDEIKNWSKSNIGDPNRGAVRARELIDRIAKRHDEPICGA